VYLKHIPSCLRDLSLIPRVLAPLWIVFLLLSSALAAQRTDPTAEAGQYDSEKAGVSGLKSDPVRALWNYGAYMDVGYAIDANHPENGLWRSKSTTFKVDEPKLNMLMGYVRKDTTPESRWGLEFGLQDGVDTEGLIPSPPPAANEPVKNADQYRHLAGANLTYWLPWGKGLGITGGLFQGYPGHESFHAIDNLNYTRGYISDNVPYFLVGAKAAYPVTDNLDLDLFAVTGYNYLANPNDVPSFGLQMGWRPTSEITITQNLYYGSDQENTQLEYWRFLSDSILEWKRDPFVVAFVFDVGTEKQAEQPGTPRYNWMASALWLGLHVGGPWHLAFRPEFYWDPNGLMTGAEQFIQAYTATLKYRFTPFGIGDLVANLEYRCDRSTGQEGGFYYGSNNRLVPNQQLLIFALTWAFGK
jgi:hypothetical protein